MKKDMTLGKPLGLIIVFAFPLFLSNFFQQVYNLADTAIIGHILGDHALSSVGSVSTIYNLITSICFGMSSGFSIMIAQHFGAHNEKMLKKSIASTIKLSIYVAIVMTVICLVFLKDFMHLINVKASLFDEAYQYIFVITAGLSVTILYNMLSSVLRALGNSVLPLIFLVISSIINVVLDIWFIGGLDMKIAGAAYATLLAQLISVVLCAGYIWFFNRDIVPSKEDFASDFTLMRDMGLSGLAMASMFAIVSLGTVILQSGINNFDDDIIAAHTMARKISEILMMPISTLSATMVTFCSQNYGAGKMKRVLNGVIITIIMGCGVSLLEMGVIRVLGKAIVVGLTGTESITIIDTASRYLNINLNFYFPLVILCVLRSSLQGIDRKGVTLFGSALEMVCKILVVMYFVPLYKYDAIIYCEPITWIICCVPVITAFVTDKNVRMGVKDKSEEQLI